MKPGISFLKNSVQEYAWGSRTAIAEILGEPCPAKTPQAELWLGAHPKAPSLVLRQDRWIRLPDWISDSPEEILGPSVAARFSDKLPFLLKILAAERPLSIQAHPDLAQAKAGFDRENSAGILPNAPVRNYRDDNHKPELLCALTPFWALKGFRNVESIVKRFEEIGIPDFFDETECLRRQGASPGLQRFFTNLLGMEKSRQQHLVSRVVARVEKMTDKDPAFEWITRLNHHYPGDIGSLSPLFLNLLHLQPGEAIFLESGTLHAYLSGTGIEVMANSDNVLRGGLTCKHIDVEELLRVLCFKEDPPTLAPFCSVSSVEGRYINPAEEFILSRIEVEKEHSHRNNSMGSVEILLCIQGKAQIRSCSLTSSVDVTKGKSVIVPACVGNYCIEGQATFYKVSVPLPKNGLGGVPR